MSLLKPTNTLRMGKIILYIATSKDGFIADKNGAVDWLPQSSSNEELEAVGYNNLMSRIDTIFMGSKSYKQISGFGEWGWKDKQTYVFSSSPIEIAEPYTSLTHQSPMQLVSSLNNKKDIWLLGGAKLAQSFAQADLIDEVILTVTSHTLGEGIPLGLSLESKFALISEEQVLPGIQQRVYLKKRDSST